MLWGINIAQLCFAPEALGAVRLANLFLADLYPIIGVCAA